MEAMRKSRLSEYKQGRLIEHLVAGTTSRRATSLVGVNFKTGVYFYHRLFALAFYHRLNQIIAYKLAPKKPTSA